MNNYSFKVFNPDGDLCGEGFGFGSNAMEAAEKAIAEGTLIIQGCMEIIAVNTITGVGFKFEIARP